MNRLLKSLMATVAVGAVACSSDSMLPTVGGTTGQQLNVSAALSAANAGNPWSYPGLSSTFAGLPALSLATPSSCTYSTTNLRFDCAPVTAAGLTFKTSYYLLATDGTSLSTPDSSRIATVRVLTDVTGTATIPSNTAFTGSVAITKHDDMTLTGLLTTSRVVNGSSTEHDVVTTTANGVTATNTVDVNSTTVNLVLPTGTGKFPASGTITTDITALVSLPPLPAVAGTTHSMLSFDGTNFATLVTTTGGHTRTCRIDLSTFSSACS